MADHPVFAAVYDGVMARAESGALGRLRAALVGRARGRTLEVGAGTAANLGYLPSAVQSLVLSEPDGAMGRRRGGLIITGSALRREEEAA
jgi:hypothetical protein